MSDERITVIERISFGADGSSHHVYEAENGARWERHHAVAPVLFQKRGLEWGLETALDRGISSVSQKLLMPPDVFPSEQ